MTDQITLLADIGATNARFALLTAKAKPASVQVLQCADFNTVEDAVDGYLQNHNISQINNICFAVAGPVIQQVVEVTNNHWLVHADQLTKRYQLERTVLLNDFESIAYSVTQLSQQQLLPLGSTHINAKQTDHFTYAILGPGSGLGVAALIKRDNNILPIVTEGGHASFAPINDVQSAVLKCLRKKYSQVSNELLLSGPGIVNIYQALCNMHDEKPMFHTPAQISQAAENAEDKTCVQCLHIFFEILGQVAGDLALTFGAFEGVYIAGGIVQRYPRLIENSQFRAGFENKTQHRALLENTPTYLITESCPGLIGAHYYASSW